MTGRLRRNISVPSSSGKSLQQSWCSIRSMGAHISVPSSSGKSLQLPFRFAPWQEPLPISVPSSSGKSLQRQLSARAFYVWANFSPLFIGEITSTPERCCVHGFLHDFSPLFIGEITSTPECAQRKDLQLGISVPSSSGKSLQQYEANQTRCWGNYFSPLFIGEITSTNPHWKRSDCH